MSFIVPAYMMCLSQTAGYAIHALSIVANRGGQYCLIRDIAREAGIPKPYLAKIINQLAHQGLVAAKRGYRGGIYLTRLPQETPLLEVVEAIEGKNFMADCMLSMDNCDRPCICPTHAVWDRVRQEISEALQHTTLADVLGSPSNPEAVTPQPQLPSACPLAIKRVAGRRRSSSSASPRHRRGRKAGLAARLRIGG